MAGKEVGGRSERKLRPQKGDSLNLRPCLVHVPTGEIVKSYIQLSRIVKKLGWKVFVNVTGNVWGAWFLPAGGEACFIQMLFLPHPHISTANFYQLSTLVQAFGPNTFQISYAPLARFKELAFFNDIQKPVLRLKANGKEIVTVRNFAQVLSHHGWKKQAENDFVKHDMIGKNPMNLLTIIRIPAVENIQQLSTLDLEYITMVTETIFYLQYPTRSQTPSMRRLDLQAAKRLQPKASASSPSTSRSEYGKMKDVEEQCQPILHPFAAKESSYGSTEKMSVKIGDQDVDKTTLPAPVKIYSRKEIISYADAVNATSQEAALKATLVAAENRMIVESSEFREIDPTGWD
ncbi:hypothetical protein R1flu_012389 [Riccia fluitans]|uniref:Uncharacterized protein n=1 Tax=Riccia fluitans TaxID=41844 RepID=A0ABD1ZAH1_9MARC